MSPHTSPHGVPVVESGENPAVDDDAVEQRWLAGLTIEQRMLLVEDRYRTMRRDTRRSLNEGAQKFSEIRAELGAINTKLERKPLSLLQLGGFLLTSFLAIGAIIWAAARYPERAEFNESRRQVDDMKFIVHDLVRDVGDVKELRRDVAEIKSSLIRLLAQGAKP